MSYLEKVLEFDPENEAAGAAYKAARDSIRANLLAEARTAAVAGNAVEANELLDAILAEEPNAEDAWVLKSHLANGFEEKIEAFKRVLEINPENASAKASLESLTSIMDAVAPKVSEAIVEESTSPADVVEDVPQFTEFAGDLAPAHEYVEETGTTAQSVEEFMAPVEVEDAVSSREVSYEGVIQVSDTEEASEESETAYSPAEIVDTDSEGEFEHSYAYTSYSFVPAKTTDEAEVPTEFAHGATNESTESSPAEVETETEAMRQVEVEEITYELAPESTNGFEPREEPKEIEEEYAVHESVRFSATEATPFADHENDSAANDYPTIASINLDPESFGIVQNFGSAENLSEGVPAQKENDVFNVPFDTTMFGGTIPRPDGGLEQAVPDVPTGFETRIVSSTDAPRVNHATTPCSFCTVENDAQAVVCQGCMAVLTLADLEMLLANHNADKSLIRQAVERMEGERSSRDFDEADLTTLGIGHLNLRNLQYAYDYLHEASQLNPNNVVLASQANALLIRLEEIKQQDAAHESMAKGKTILVVDDSPTVRKLISGKLEKCGHDVFCSNDGVEAMERLQDLRPDLVLLDITMPRMDGYQVCKLIRSNNATKDVPVVMISGKDGFFDKVRGRMAGTSGYITKPFGPETLMKAVESYLNGGA